MRYDVWGRILLDSLILAGKLSSRQYSNLVQVIIIVTCPLVCRPGRHCGTRSDDTSRFLVGCEEISAAKGFRDVDVSWMVRSLTVLKNKDMEYGVWSRVLVADTHHSSHLIGLTFIRAKGGSGLSPPSISCSKLE